VVKNNEKKDILSLLLEEGKMQKRNRAPLSPILVLFITFIGFLFNVFGENESLNAFVNLLSIVAILLLFLIRR
jgi:hypothetical protein